MLTMTFVAPIIAAAAAATPVPSANRRRRLSRRRHQRHRRGATRRVRDEQGGGGQRTSVTIHRPSHAAAGCWARRYRSLLEKTSKTKFSSPTSCSTGHTRPASSSCVSSSEPSSSADDVPSRPDWAQRTSLPDGAFHCFALHPRRKWSMKNHRNYWRTHKTIHPFFHCSRSTSSSRLQLQCGCGWNEGSRISYLGWGGQRRRGAPGYVVLHRRQPVGASCSVWHGRGTSGGMGKVEVKGVGTVGSTTLLAWWSGLHAWGQASVFLVCAGESMEYSRYSLIYLVRIECTHESWSHLMAVSLGAAAPRFRKDFPAHSFLVSSAAA